MTLSDAELERYARHIVLKEIGGSGQMRLKASRVAVIGAGGIGSPAIQYLAAAGIGKLRVIDDDRVDLSNLQRQTLFGGDDLGQPKAAAAALAIRRLNRMIEIETRQTRLNAGNAASLLEGCDVVLDGSDNFTTRLIVAQTALTQHIPLVSAAVGQFEGQLGIYRGWEADRPCYHCLVGGDPDRPEQSCAEAGVMGAMAGVMGSLAALEVIRALVPFGDDPAGKLLIVDALAFRFRTLVLPKDPACPACGN